MFSTLCGLVPMDGHYPQRTRRLGILKQVLDGTLYDALPFEFHEERGAGGEYIPLRSRRPSVRYPLARIVVDDSISLVFSEGHFPTIDCDDRRVRAAFADLARECALNQVMMEAALRGAIGSVAILFRVLKGRVFFRVLETPYLTPEWDALAPDELLHVTELYKVPGRDLLARGYEAIEPQVEYWFMRRWDRVEESWFVPVPVAGGARPRERDAARSVRHGLGFVPVVWVKNLPGGPDGVESVDGACTFRAAVETNIEIDYQLSQAGRGLKYSSDPTLLIREPAGMEGEMIRGGGNALVVSEKGDARLLEIGGTASAAVIEYVRTLREMALEGVHGNRANPDRLSAAQSGRAIEMMNQGLVWLADNLRVSYGDALLKLARMVVRASNLYPLRILGQPIEPMPDALRLGLIWPRWYAPTSEDRARDAQTLRTLTEAGQLSRETAVKTIADIYDIEDVHAEIARITAEQAGTVPREGA
ncbi:MAG: phage portal protein [Acetobacteraceae bacterium]|nr:phage portal protein [Acetobacteraceae bacterium]